MDDFKGTERQHCVGVNAYGHALVTNGRRTPYIKGLHAQECSRRNQAWTLDDNKRLRAHMHAKNDQVKGYYATLFDAKDKYTTSVILKYKD